jgi:hypothetical protein
MSLNRHSSSHSLQGLQPRFEPEETAFLIEGGVSEVNWRSKMLPHRAQLSAYSELPLAIPESLVRTSNPPDDERRGQEPFCGLLTPCGIRILDRGALEVIRFPPRQ